MKIAQRIVDVVSGFSGLVTKMQSLLQTSNQKLGSLRDKEDADQQDLKRICDYVCKCQNDIQSYFGDDGTLSKLLIEAKLVGEVGSKPQSATKGPSGTGDRKNLQELAVQYYENVVCSNRTSVKRASLHGQESWVISSPSNQSDSETMYIEIALPEAVDLAAISIQGGILPAGMQQRTAQSGSDNNAQGTHGKTSMPCGVTLDQCDGAVARTISMVGDILSWEALIKKNPPEKFLARPPVRFLFDLIVMVIQQSGLSVFSSEDFPKWETISASKESKLQFMEQV